MLMTCAVFFTVSCGGGGKNSNKLSESKIESMTNEELSDEIFTLYEQGMLGMGEILEKYPEANKQMKADFEKLFDETINQILVFGKVISKKESGETEEIAMELMKKMFQATDLSQVLDTYNSRSSEINDFDAELAKKMVAMNTVTQYAFYDLLKEQNPEEAERLGIK